MAAISAEVWAATTLAAAILPALIGGDDEGYIYRPDPRWLQFQYDIMAGIDAGIKEGGYTFSEETANLIKRSATEAIGIKYTDAERRVKEAIAPYGNIGAIGRGLTRVGIARGQEEAGAIRSVDIERALQKEKSRMGLLQLGAGIQDPTLPGYQGQLAQAQQPDFADYLSQGLQQGLGVGYNVWQTGEQQKLTQDIWDKIIKGQETSPYRYGLLGGGSQPSLRYSPIYPTYY